MAEEARGNGQSNMPTAMPDGPQQLIVNAQYIKDLSFENPRAPQSLIQQTTQPSVDINVDVKAQIWGPRFSKSSSRSTRRPVSRTNRSSSSSSLMGQW